jgi:hypothetical protein
MPADVRLNGNIISNHMFKSKQSMPELRALATLSKAAELGSRTSDSEVSRITHWAASESLMQPARRLGVKLLMHTPWRLALPPECLCRQVWRPCDEAAAP